MSYEKSFDWPLIQSFTPMSKEYIYRSQAARLMGLMKSFNQQDGHDSRARRTEIDFVESGRTFAVTGERGNGKTTFLNYFGAQLPLQAPDFYLLKPINPTNFNSHLSVLEALVANLREVVQGQTQSIKNNPFERNQLDDAIQRVTNAISLIRIDRSEAATSQSANDYLGDSQLLKNISQNLSELIHIFLNFESKLSDKSFSRLVLMIDDLDMISSKHVYQAWTDIQNVLADTPLYILLTYRDSQIRHALVNHLISENRDLMCYKQISVDELNLQVASMLSKQVPEQQIVKLKSASDLMKKPLQELVLDIYPGTALELQDLLWKMLGITGSDHEIDREFSNVSTIEWIELFFRANLGLRWRPVAEFENVEGIWPRSYREFIDFFKLVTRIADHIQEGKDTRASLSNSALDWVRQYLLDMGTKYLPQNLANILRTLDQVEVESKNYEVYSALYSIENQIRVDCRVGRSSIFDSVGVAIDVKNSPTLDSPILRANFASRENVAIGDILNLIWILEAQITANSEMAIFLCTIKRLYGIYLNQAINQSIGQEVPAFREALDNYRMLTKTLMMPEDYDYFNRKLSTLGVDRPLPSRSTFREPAKDVYVPLSLVQSSSIISDASRRKVSESYATRFIYSIRSIHSRYGRMLQPRPEWADAESENDNSMLMQYTGGDYFRRYRGAFQPKTSTRYAIDFYSWLLQSDYLEQASVESAQFSSSDKTVSVNYLMVNVFDIDEFMHTHYSRQSNDSLGMGSRVVKVLQHVYRAIADTYSISFGHLKLSLIGNVLYNPESVMVNFAGHDDWPFATNQLKSSQALQDEDDEDFSDEEDYVEDDGYPSDDQPIQNPKIICDLEQMILGKIPGTVLEDNQKLLDFMQDHLINTDGTVKKVEIGEAKRDTATVWVSLKKLRPSTNWSRFSAFESFQGSTGRKNYSDVVKNQLSQIYDIVRAAALGIDSGAIQNILTAMTDTLISNPNSNPVTMRLMPNEDRRGLIRSILGKIAGYQLNDVLRHYPELGGFANGSITLRAADVRTQVSDLYHELSRMKD